MLGTAGTAGKGSLAFQCVVGLIVVAFGLALASPALATPAVAIVAPYNGQQLVGVTSTNLDVAITDHTTGWKYQLADMTAAGDVVASGSVLSGTRTTLSGLVAGRSYTATVTLRDGEGLTVPGISAVSMFTVEAASSGFVLTGNYVQVGINKDGSLIDENSHISFRYQPAGTGVFTSRPDYFYPGSPLEAYAVKVDSTTTRAEGPLSTTIPGVLRNTSAGALRRAEYTATIAPGILIQQTISFDGGSTAARFDVFIRNIDRVPHNVRYLRNMDPDQGVTYGSSFSTYNDIVAVPQGKLVTAGTTSWGWFGLGATGLGDAVAFEVASYQVDVESSGLFTYDPDHVLTAPNDPNGTLSDVGINIAFDLGTLLPGQGKSFTFYMIGGNSKDEVVTTFDALGTVVYAPITLGGLGMNTSALTHLAQEAVHAAVAAAPLSETDRSLLASALESHLLVPVIPGYPAAPAIYPSYGNEVVRDNFGNPLTIQRGDFTTDLSFRAGGVGRVLGAPKLGLVAGTGADIASVKFELSTPTATHIGVSASEVTATAPASYRFVFDEDAALEFLGHWPGTVLPDGTFDADLVTAYYAQVASPPADARTLTYSSVPLSYTGSGGVWAAEEPVALMPGMHTVYYFVAHLKAPISTPTGPVSTWALPDPYNMQWVNRGAMENLTAAVARYGLGLDDGDVDPLDARRFASIVAHSLVKSGNVALASMFALPPTGTTRTWSGEFPLTSLLGLSEGVHMVRALGFNVDGKLIARSTDIPLVMDRAYWRTVNLSTISESLIGFGAKPTQALSGVTVDDKSAVVAGATVVVHEGGLTGPVVDTVISGAEGGFTIELEVGEYTIVASAPLHAAAVAVVPIVAGTSPATLRLVLSTNLPPTIGTIAPVTTRRNRPVTVPLPISDAESDPINVTAEPGSGLSVRISETTTGFYATVTPSVGFLGETSFTVVASDAKGSSSRSVPVTVLENRLPILEPIANLILDEGHGAVVPLHAADPDGEPVTLSARSSDPRVKAVPEFSATDGHQLVIIPDSTFNTLETGPVEIVVSATDFVDGGILPFFAVGGHVVSEGALPSTAEVDVTVLGMGTVVTAPIVDGAFAATFGGSLGVPVGALILIEVFEDAASTTPIGTVVRQMTPADADAASLITEAIVGRFDPVPELASTTTFHVTIKPREVAPVATPAEFTINEDETLELVLEASDLNAEDVLTFRIVIPPAHGTLTGVGASLVYTSEKDYYGDDAFTFVANDGTFDSEPALVKIVIRPVNDRPFFLPVAERPIELLSLTVQEGQRLIGVPIPVEDVDDEELIFLLTSIPTSGNNVTFNHELESFNYDARLGFTGLDVFTIAASDGELDTDPLVPFEIAIKVTVDPTRPVAAAVPPVTTPRAKPVDITLAATPVGVPVTFVVKKTPANGTVAIKGNVATYTPKRDFVGEDSFDFVAANGPLESAAVTAKITVTPADDPTVLNPAATLPRDQRISNTSDPVVTELGGPTPLFIDPDSDVVLNVASSDSKIVAAALDGTRLAITPGKPGVATITIGAKTATATVTFNVEVVAGAIRNTPPTVARIPAQTFFAGTPNVFSISATDRDGDKLVYGAGKITETTTPAKGDEPLSVNVEAATGKVTMNVSAQVSRDRRFSVILTASDGVNEPVTAEVAVRVQRLNRLPVVVVAETAAAKVGEAVAIAVRATDPDAGSTLTFSVSSSERDPSVLSAIRDFLTATAAKDGDAFIQTLRFTPAARLDGTLVAFRWTVSDGELATGATTNVTVGEVKNLPPVVEAIAAQNVKEGETWSFAVTASDPEKQPLSFTAEGLPKPASLDSKTGAFLWKDIPYDASGSFVIRLNVSDGDKVTSVGFTLVVADVNRPPVFDDLKAAITMQKGVVNRLSVSGSDPDGGDVVLELVGLPSYARVVSTRSGRSPRQSLELLPPTDAENFSFIARLTDSARAVTEVTVAVTLTDAPNRAPTIRPILPVAVDEGVQAVVTVVAEDPDGDPLTLTATPLPEGATFEKGTLTWTPGPRTAAKSPYLITIKADDGKDGIMERTARIDVRVGANLPPRLAAIPPQRVLEGAELALNLLEGAVDPNGDPMTVTYETTFPADRLSYDSAKSILTLRPVAGDAGVYPVRLRVSDGRGGETARAVVVMVLPAEGAGAGTFAILAAVADPTVGTSADTYFVSAIVQHAEGAPPTSVTVVVSGTGDGAKQTVEMTKAADVSPTLSRYSADLRLPVGNFTLEVTAALGEATQTRSGGTIQVLPETIEIRNLRVTGLSADGVLNGDAIIEYDLFNPNPGEPVGVVVGYRIPGQAWQPATVRGSMTAQLPGPQVLIWSSETDLPLADGQAVAIAVQAPGALRTISASFLVDNEAPPLTLDPIASPSSVRALTITGVTERDAVVSFRIDGRDAGGATPRGDGSFRFVTAELTDGDHEIVAVAREGALEGTPVTARVLVDATPPVVTIVTPPEGAREVATLTPMLRATATSSGGISRVEMRLNGVPVSATFDGTTGEATYTPTEPLVQRRPYLMTVEATGSNGLVGTGARLFTPNVTAADTVAPTAGTLEPANGSTVVTSRPAISATLSDAETGIDAASIALTIDDAPAVVNVSPLDERSVLVTVTGELTLADGVHKVAATFKDKATNSGSASWSFTVATAPPAVPTVVLASTSTNTSPYTVTGTAGADIDVSVVANGTIRGTTKTDAKGKWNLAVTFRTPGEKLVQAFATNAAGLSSALSSPQALLYDTQAPRIVLATPVLGTPTGNLKPRFEGAVTDALSGVDAASVKLEIAGAAVTATFDAALGRLVYDPPTAFATGTSVSIKITATDKAGNSGELAGTIPFDARLADSTPPAITSARINGTALVAGGSVTVAGGPSTIRFFVTDENSGVASVTGTLDGSDATFALADGVATLSQTFAAGSHTLLVQATDAARNQTPIVQYDFVVDDSTPAPTVRVIPGGGESRTTGSARAAEEAIVGTGLERGAAVRVLLNGLPVEARVTGTTFRSSAVVLNEGDNTIVVTVQDGVGNTATTTLTVRRDATPPTVTFLEPVPGAFVGGNQTRLRVGFADASGIDPSSVRVTLDGALLAVTAEGTGFTHSLAGPLAGSDTLLPARHDLVVTVSDTSGNQATASNRFYVDASAPLVEGLSPRPDEVIRNTEPTISATILEANPDPRGLVVRFGPSGGTLEDVTASVTYSVVSGQVTYAPLALTNRTSYTVSIDAKDAAGNAAPTTTWTFTVDTSATDRTPPTITITFPRPDSSISDTGLDSLNFSIGDGSPLDPRNIFLFLNDPTGGRPLSLAGLISTGSAAFNRETGEVQLMGRRLFLPLQTTRGGFSLDPLELSALERSLGGGGASFDPLELNALERSLGSGTTGSFDPLELNALERSLTSTTGALGVGTNTIGIQVADDSGNVSFVEWPFTVSLQAPAAPTFDALPSPTNQGTISVKGRIPDITGPLPMTVSLSVNGVGAGSAQVTDASGVYEVKNVILRAGTNRLTATAQDSAGNLSQVSNVASIVLDQTLPTITVDPIASVSASASLRVKGSITDNVTNALKSAAVVVNGVETALSTVQGAFDRSVTLRDGANTVVVKASDAAGNATSSATINVTLSGAAPKSAPSLPFVRPTADSRGVRLDWSADPNAASYAVFRSPNAIANASGLTPLAPSVAAVSYTDTTITAGSTVHYGLVSVNVAGVSDPTVVSPDLNVALIKGTGGTASLSDGTRLVVPSRGLFSNILLAGTVQLTQPSGLPALAGAVAGSARGVVVRNAAGELIESFNQPATLTLPVPTGMSITADSPRVHQLVGGTWRQLDARASETTRTVTLSVSGSATFQFSAVSATPWDANGDGTVDIIDLVSVARRFGESGAGLAEDVTGDGVVDIADLVTVGRHFGESTRSAAPSLAASSDGPVRVSMRVAALGDERYEVRLSAESSVALGGFQFRAESSDTRVSIEEVEDSAIFGERAFWTPARVTATDALVASARLDLNDGSVSDEPTSGAMARIVLRAHGGLSASQVAAMVRLRDVRFADTRGAVVGYRLGEPLISGRDGIRTALLANYPNPFNPETWIPFSLADESAVTIRIYDAQGALVKTLDLGALPAGDYAERGRAARWDGANELGERVASGVYFYELRAGSFRETRRMVIHK
ncbi:tandem-95 repeat protein [Candidatus Poribacteria bacterium]|nr:tandem-95 repeat protein [Candidatus Poribacteria bacterium]